MKEDKLVYEIDRYSYTIQGMECDESGEWVDYKDYSWLLEQYKHLKYRMDSLEK